MLSALYFEVLGFTQSNLELLEHNFHLTRLADPGHCTDEILSNAEVIFAPLGYLFDESFLRRASKLRVIATNTTGVPHIDVRAAQSRGVKVVSLAEETEFLQSITPTAELALGLIIAVSRNVTAASAAVKDGIWRRWDHGGPAMLSRMSLGVVGFGRLGKMLAGYAACLGMQVGYFDPYLSASSNSLSGYRAFDSLESLVEAVDIVSVHASMSKQSRGMFNDHVFGRFRRGAYFVNTARAELVDSEALLRALESRQLAGAALDVLDGEFDPSFQGNVGNHPLVRYACDHSNLLITPHIGGSTRDAWSLTQEHTIRKAINVASLQARFEEDLS